MRKRRLAGPVVGNPNSPTPARVVTARSDFTPFSRVTVYRPGFATSCAWLKLLAYFVSVVSAVGDESTSPTYGTIGTSPAAPAPSGYSGRVTGR
ncbi:hypothetical protein EV648_104139 [Kribbella sp. VKM Ac-2568]|nr:hypothetical protein EV648_104139 [Kribbella sp. VKM Ac-2568]